MECARCGKKLDTVDRRRRYCSVKCRENRQPKTQRHLRAVDSDETALPSEPRRLTVDVAAKEGSDLELLMSMRDRVAEAVANPNCPARDLAALTRRLEELRKEIGVERMRLKEEAADAEIVEDEDWDEASL